MEGSQIRGIITLTPDDPPEIRWTWVVRYSGFDRWRLEGVQIGGCRSPRGIVGIWSDIERADLSPVGPFTYWFVDKDKEEEMRREAGIRVGAGVETGYGQGNPHAIVEEDEGEPPLDQEWENEWNGPEYV